MEEELRSDLKNVVQSLRADRGACPGVEELLAYSGRNPAVRPMDPIHPHVSICSKCQLILLKAEAPKPAERPVLQWRVPLAVAAAVFLAVVVPIAYRSLYMTPPPEDTIRGTDIQLVAPLGSVKAPVEFRWQSPIRNVTYRINVYKESNRIFSDTTSQSTRALPQEVQPGAEYTWEVEAVDSAGAVRIRSPRAAFSISP